MPEFAAIAGALRENHVLTNLDMKGIFDRFRGCSLSFQPLCAAYSAKIVPSRCARPIVLKFCLGLCVQTRLTFVCPGLAQGGYHSVPPNASSSGLQRQRD
eukprot:4223474-Prymnesium_polylepis.1